MLSTAIPDNSL